MLHVYVGTCQCFLYVVLGLYKCHYLYIYHQILETQSLSHVRIFENSACRIEIVASVSPF